MCSSVGKTLNVCTLTEEFNVQMNYDTTMPEDELKSKGATNEEQENEDLFY